ncbi:hypothetical protein [Nonlabens sp.]|uniref:hypothetical protein n=1 Tax=Nonlabens sp. TaxID=1888209 RepID=UPI0025E386EB|nr:hypothetical protein [Nonlabens sp.]
MRLYIFLLFISLLACKPTSDEGAALPEQIDDTTMNLSKSKIPLIKEAQKKALEWKSFQDLLTGLENYDHTASATSKMIDHVNDMLLNPEASFQDQAVFSRIKVLKTRLHIYKSYLGYRTKTPSQLEEKYNNIIRALEELIIQMNWKVNEFRQSNDKLLEDLKADIDPEEK